MQQNKLSCACCGNAVPLDQTMYQRTSELTFTRQSAQIVIEQEQRPIIDETCPKCGNAKAYYEAKQMRSADEGQTVFFECTKCKHKSKQNT